jgi:glyoxylase-like metal-dependent hydrolase (beta-lactamase superfamily II)
LAPRVAFLQAGFSNVYFVGDSTAGNAAEWALVDTGVVGYGPQILAAAAARFGPESRPQAIYLTHGHYDQAGCARDLVAAWDVPVFVHPMELPYLTGKSDYPQKDPTVGGAMGFLSRFFPSKTVDLRGRVSEPPESGALPGMAGWTAIHTPGHAPGHVSFWNAEERVLLAGDALATADLDSWRGMASQKHRISGPPSPFTYDWEQSRASVLRLAELRPAVLACAHGQPIASSGLTSELDRFAADFRPPARGRYVENPAKTDLHGVVYEPPPRTDRLPRIAAGLVAGTFVLAGALYHKRGRKASRELS